MTGSGAVTGVERLRPGVVSDAEGMCQVRFAAIRETAAAFYPAAEIDGWARPPDEERIARFRRAIAGNDESFIVAEHAGTVVGFGSIVASNRELRSLYVHPRFGRRGVGSAIFRQLEELAIAAGIDALGLTASLNAEQFYRRHGFDVVSRGIHRSSTGLEMACVWMKKTLPRQGAGAESSSA